MDFLYGTLITSLNGVNLSHIMLNIGQKQNKFHISTHHVEASAYSCIGIIQGSRKFSYSMYVNV